MVVHSVFTSIGLSEVIYRIGQLCLLTINFSNDNELDRIIGRILDIITIIIIISIIIISSSSGGSGIIGVVFQTSINIIIMYYNKFTCNYLVFESIQLPSE